MIVFDGFKLIGLGISLVLLVAIYLVICIIANKFHERRDKKNREWWDKRESEDNE